MVRRMDTLRQPMILQHQHREAVRQFRLDRLRNLYPQNLVRHRRLVLEFHFAERHRSEPGPFAPDCAHQNAGQHQRRGQDGLHSDGHCCAPCCAPPASATLGLGIVEHHGAIAQPSGMFRATRWISSLSPCDLLLHRVDQARIAVEHRHLADHVGPRKRTLRLLHRFVQRSSMRAFSSSQSATGSLRKRSISASSELLHLFHVLAGPRDREYLKQGRSAMVRFEAHRIRCQLLLFHQRLVQPR